MDFQHPLAGVYAACLTPLLPDFSPDFEAIPIFLEFLAKRGCHGALLMGTTGEGPSFAPGERLELLRACLSIRQSQPNFHILVGTGTPSLTETIALTRAAFDLGVDGVVVLPPYYFRKIGDDGLFTWFSQVLKEAVPEGATLLGYHIPPLTGIPLSLNLLTRLKNAFPGKFAGIKDSSSDPDNTRRLGESFGNDLLVFNGNDRLFSLALNNKASGCITALANLFSPILRIVWDAHQRGQADPGNQAFLNNARDILDKYPPAPPLLKALLARNHAFPQWAVRPPLMPLSPESIESASLEFNAIQDA